MMDQDQEIDDTTDGPDVLAARRAAEESRASTADTKIALAESKRVTGEIQAVTEANHFVDKWREIIRARVSYVPNREGIR